MRPAPKPLDDITLRMIANARMYSVTPEAAAAWKALLQEVLLRAKMGGEVIDYPAPAPLEALWQRADLGCVFMCGLPFSLGLFPVAPLVAPVPLHSLGEGAGTYRSRLIVAQDSPFQRIEETFEHRLAFTNPESHSGYSALRHHLLPFLATGKHQLYATTLGPLITPRRVVEAIVSGSADIGPVDGYAFELLSRYEPELMRQVRVIDSTAPAPMPLLVSAATLPPEKRTALQQIFLSLEHDPRVANLLNALLLKGFIIPDPVDYQVLAQRADNACQQGYSHLA